jgi:hypothetical protein
MSRRPARDEKYCSGAFPDPNQSLKRTQHYVRVLLNGEPVKSVRRLDNDSLQRIGSGPDGLLTVAEFELLLTPPWGIR